ncbi:stalk domain-containing protein (plasmid) [Aneurinibacillus sp. Ricciae_BoGa-3]|uniref:stalk domain-containing protein n=1 Tax=Aneurinibacillus sp. Ricciae_BoGa-3 TaxID=3022697 RepID=UPI002341FDC0|nr:stalk domain-containing protein [Aneurinibacillus sp. Ricciae_BoGa-3]WCK57733.1 stalk domain-containing protein [Aneurinibacillus sp. Ricciae_BoGa-3]
MKKLKQTIILTALLVGASSLPVFASGVNMSNIQTPQPTFYNSDNANSQQNVQTLSQENQKIDLDLQNRKKTLEQTVYARTFSSLSLSEKSILLEKYFSVRANLYKESQKKVLSLTNPSDLNSLQQALLTDSDNENKDNQLLMALFQQTQEKKSGEQSKLQIQNMKNLVAQLVVTYKDFRNAGRNLQSLMTAEMSAFNAPQLTLLNKFSQQYEIGGDQQQALKIQEKILKLTNGDTTAYENVARILQTQNKSFFFVDNEVIQTDTPLLYRDGNAYIELRDVSKVKGFHVSLIGDTFRVQERDNLLSINMKDKTVSLNGMAIGKDIAVMDGNKVYLPLNNLFSMFHYQVNWNEQLASIIIQKEVYPLSEIDRVNLSDVANVVLQ